MISSTQIRAARALLELNQADAATLVGISTPALSAIESGASQARRSTLKRIRDAFESAGVRFLDADEDGGEGVRFK